MSPRLPLAIRPVSRSLGPAHEAHKIGRALSTVVGTVKRVPSNQLGSAAI